MWRTGEEGCFLGFHRHACAPKQAWEMGSGGCGHQPRTEPPGALGVETPGPALSLLDAGGPEANADHRTSSSRMNLRATTPPKLLCAPGKFLGLSEPASSSGY